MDTINRIASFSINHDILLPGLYVSRIDGDITTYDLRFCRPNMGHYLSNPVLHTFEHLFATYIRNGSMSDKIIYFGPMGCQTGFYLLVRNADNQTVLREVLTTLDKIIAHDGPIFGAAARECGNYLSHDLEGAKAASVQYLADLSARPVTFEYQE